MLILDSVSPADDLGEDRARRRKGRGQFALGAKSEQSLDAARVVEFASND